VGIIRENVNSTGFAGQSTISQGDALAFLSRCREKFDLIFLDPPYGSGLLEKAMEAITTIDIVSENGIIVCENGSNSVWPVVAEPYRMQKEYRYGKIRTALYRRNAE
jgi:16S rRNA G966 N2-methylase RsmD